MLNTMFMIGILKQMYGMFLRKTKQIYYFQNLNSTKLNKFGIKTKIKVIKKKLKKNINPRKSYSLLSYSNISKSKFVYFLLKIHFLKNYHLTISLYLVSDI